MLRGKWDGGSDRPPGRPMQQGSKNPWFDFEELQKDAKASASRRSFGVGRERKWGENHQAAGKLADGRVEAGPWVGSRDGV